MAAVSRHLPARRAPRRAVAAAATLVLALVGAACSSGDDTSTDVEDRTDPTTTEVDARGPTPPDRDAVSVPTIEGPVTGGKGTAVVATLGIDLAAVGYQEAELFLDGTATSYAAEGELTSDGRWTVVPDETVDYRTRILSRWPTDPARFSGTVVVEWLNVSAGLDTSADWTYAHVELLREGHAWVGVSAQQAGVEGGGNSLGSALALKVTDPERYGTLDHPGDDYSYDIFSQAGAAVWFEPERVLGGLEPAQVLAMGESQSAFRLTTYVNAVAPLTDVFDGYLIHSRSGGGAPLSAATEAPDPNHIRDDLEVPVFVLNAETDLVGDRLGAAAARRANDDRYREWEVAGTAHADAYNLGIGDSDDGSGAADTELFAAQFSPPTGVYSGIISCDRPINAGPHTYVLRAALHWLDRWVRTGEAPPEMPRLELTDDETGYELDELGNAKGGVRTPHVDVPVAVHSGLGQSGEGFCGLFGTTTPLDDATLARLYPDHATFVEKWTAAVDAAVESGAILPPDADQLRRVAQESTVGA